MWEKFSIIESMKRYIKYVTSIIKYFLCSLTMMNVPIYDNSIFFSPLSEIVSSNSYIVKKGKSMWLIFHSAMVSRRSNQTYIVPNLLLLIPLLHFCFPILSQTILHGIDTSLNGFKSSIICLSHVIRIRINKHFVLTNSFTPHSLNKIIISLSM